MKIQQLRYFVAVYEEGSFSAGALRVNATQSGLSMQVRDLEERHGVILFNRTSSGVTPSAAGRRFYTHALRVLRAVSDAEEELRRMRGEVVGHLRVGLMPTFTRSVLPEALQQFTSAFPRVQVAVLEAYSAQLSDATARGELDFAIVPAFAETPGLRARPMGTDREYFVTAAGTGRPHGLPLRLRDLGPLRLVLPGETNARRSRIDAYLASQGVEVTDVLELDAMLGTLELVARSDWCTILPGILCHGDASGRVRALHPIVDPVLTVDYVRIEPAARSLSEAATAFEGLIQQELDRLIRWDLPQAVAG